jgi:hypothetical protein
MTLRVWCREIARTDRGRGARGRHDARSRSDRQTAPSDDGGELPPGNTKVRDSRKTLKCEWGQPSDSPAAVNLTDIIISPDYRLLGRSCEGSPTWRRRQLPPAFAAPSKSRWIGGG